MSTTDGLNRRKLLAILILSIGNYVWYSRSTLVTGLEEALRIACGYDPGSQAK